MASCHIDPDFEYTVYFARSIEVEAAAKAVQDIVQLLTSVVEIRLVETTEDYPILRILSAIQFDLLNCMKPMIEVVKLDKHTDQFAEALPAFVLVIVQVFEPVFVR